MQHDGVEAYKTSNMALKPIIPVLLNGRSVYSICLISRWKHCIDPNFNSFINVMKTQIAYVLKQILERSGC